MNNQTFTKNYIAITDGIFSKKHDVINASIARCENSIIKRCVKDDGQVAITEYYTIKEFCNMSLVYITLQTGRTHQIRVHMAYIGHPIIGDSLYGNVSNLITRQALHSCKVRFIHPITKQYMNIEADLPEDIIKIIKE